MKPSPLYFQRLFSGLKRAWQATGPFANWQASLGPKRAKVLAYKIIDFPLCLISPEGTKLEVKRMEFLGKLKAVSPRLLAAVEKYQDLPEVYMTIEQGHLLDTNYLKWYQDSKQTIDELAHSIASGEYQTKNLMRDIHNLIALHPHYTRIAPLLLEILSQHTATAASVTNQLIEEVRNPFLHPPKEGYFESVWSISLQVLAHLRQTNAIPVIIRSADLLYQTQNESNLSYAIKALGQLKTRAAIPLLSKIVREGNPRNTLSAIDSLGLIRDPSTSQTLGDSFETIKLWRDEHDRFWGIKQLLYALHHIEGNEAIKHLDTSAIETLSLSPDHRARIMQIRSMLLSGNDELFLQRNSQWGWFQRDPGISLLVRKLNCLPFVRETVESCSGHSDTIPMDLSPNPYITISYNADSLSISRAREFHKALLRIGLKINPNVFLAGQKRAATAEQLPNENDPKWSYYFDTNKSTTAGKLKANWDALETVTDGFLQSKP